MDPVCSPNDDFCHRRTGTGNLLLVDDLNDLPLLSGYQGTKMDKLLSMIMINVADYSCLS